MGDAVMLAFFFVMHRVASGARNGAMYVTEVQPGTWPAKMVAAQAVISLLLLWAAKIKHWPLLSTSHAVALGAAAVLAAGICSIVTLQYRNNSAPKWARDLHLWTAAEQAALLPLLLLSGWDGVVAAICSVYPAVTAQKAVINYSIGENWDYDGTDDPTGKTYGIPSLGIKIPRTTQITRLWLSLASFILLIIYAKFFAI